MVINTNATASFSQRVLSNSTTALSKSLAKLSSGSRIVTPDDDAAGLAVSMKFRAELKRIGAARTNVGNAMSFSSTQDGFMGTVEKALRRMSELSVLAGDQTKSTTDVDNYQKEFAELKSFISRTSSKTFNGTGLFSAATLENKTLGTYNANVSTAYNDITTTNTLWVANPATVANNGSITGVAAATTGIFTSTAHGMTTGMQLTLVSQTSGATTSSTFTDAGDTAYVKKIDANTFSLYTDSALSTAVVVGTAIVGATVTKSGDYSTLKDLRTDLADMAQELYQFERNTDTAKTAYASTLDWENTYDFWQTRIGNSWTGVRAHTDDHTNGADPASKFANHALHVGNADAMSDSLIENYKKMVADIQSYVTNNTAGITVTDNSAGTTYQLKGADLTGITNAIDSSTATNSINSALSKTNAGTHTTNLSVLITNLAGSRAYVGANISRLGMVDSQLAVYNENLSAANSRIEDVDIATETSEYAKQQILVQSGTAMLSQANMLPQAALKLLQ